LGGKKLYANYNYTKVNIGIWDETYTLTLPD
jgi:hypothetical protein